MATIDISRPRLQRSALAASALTSAFPITVSFTVLAIVINRAGGSAFEVSMVVTVHYLGLLLFAPVWGALGDSTGRRRGVLIGTSVLAVVTLALVGIFDRVWWLIGMRGLFAVFAAAYQPLTYTIVSERGGMDRRGRLLGEFNSARSLGFALGQLSAGVFLALFTSLDIFLLLGGLYFVVLAAVVLIEDPTPTQPSTPDVSRLVADVKRRLVPDTDDRVQLQKNGLHYLYLSTVCYSVMFYGILSLLPVFLTDGIGVTEVLVGVFLAMNPAGRAVFMYAFGHAVDFRGRKSIIAWGLVGTGVFGLVLSAATYPAGLLHRQLLTGAGFLLIALAISAYTVGSLAFIGDIAPEGRESELMGLRDTALGVGGVVGPVLFGGAVTVLGYRTAFVVWSAFAFLGVVLVARGVAEPA